MDAPLALYRRYRPDTFDEVIGQEHVTTPLSHALASNRVNHAYLFSGPRGCGKTTSARIMARALNCDQGPTATPCGECESCQELARGGPGSIDVIEIDAASHGGVDDARELRERAFFAPVKSRFKVYIIDEAHMVTTQGFNALLKLVEEPPGHLRFIFATTEPEKVIGTIKSRTHHYPFRLVPPKVLGEYVQELCTREGVTIEPTVVPLIVRAGAGSVRDSLSVLDQLIGGSGPEGVTYRLATALLGYTPESLLDEAVDAIAAEDGGTLFGVIEKVVETGQDPRRFAEDLLHRLRDLVVLAAVPDAAHRGLIELSGDQAERLSSQANRFGRAELTRAADLVSAGLTEMRGATAPRLLLEILCARLLLPGLDDTAEGFGSRLDRVERRLSVVTPSAAAAAAPTTRDLSGSEPAMAASRPDTSVDRDSGEWDSGQAEAAAPAAGPTTDWPTAATPGSDVPQRESSGSAVATGASAQTTTTAAAAPSPTSGRTADPSAARPGDSQSQLGLVDVRRLWPGVLERVQKTRRYAWMLLSQNAQVKDVSGGVITIGMVNAGARDSFLRSGADEILRQAMIDELGVDLKVEAIIDSSIEQAKPVRSQDLAESRRPKHNVDAPSGPRAEPHASAAPSVQPEVVVPAAATAGEASPPPAARVSRAAEVEAAKEAIRQSRNGNGPGLAPEGTDAGVGDDDPVMPDDKLGSHELLARELGAEIIDDIPHDQS